jgi:hypothetical protein
METQLINSLLFQAFTAEHNAVTEASRAVSASAPIVAMAQLPPQIDYSPYVHYIRHQGIPGWGCFNYALAACWDIQNERVCPRSPNVSVNRMLWCHTMLTPAIVGQAMEADFRKSGATTAADAVAQWFAKRIDFSTPDGKPCKNGDDYLTSFGVPTEGTEWTDPDGVRWPTEEGDYEASNFRMKGKKTIPVDLNSLRNALIQGPLRIAVPGPPGRPGHFVALVGYDDVQQCFKYLDSAGDRNGGFGYIEYSKLSQKVEGAEFFEFHAPKSVPTATITLQHSFRQDVYLWLRVEDCTYAKRIWPNSHRQDDSRNLSFTVMLPRGFVWPPGSGNRIFLDVYDCGAHTTSGGTIELSVSFCGQEYVTNNPNPVPIGYVTAPTAFHSRELLTLHVP